MVLAHYGSEGVVKGNRGWRRRFVAAMLAACTHADSMAAGELARERVRLPSGGGKHQIPRSYRRPFEM